MFQIVWNSPDKFIEAETTKENSQLRLQLRGLLDSGRLEVGMLMIPLREEINLGMAIVLAQICRNAEDGNFSLYFRTSEILGYHAYDFTH